MAVSGVGGWRLVTKQNGDAILRRERGSERWQGWGPNAKYVKMTHAD
jgi:hypothetical protein